MVIKGSNYTKADLSGAFATYYETFQRDVADLNRKATYFLFALNFPTEDKELFLSYAMSQNSNALFDFLCKRQKAKDEQKGISKGLRSYKRKYKPFFEETLKKYGLYYTAIREEYRALKEFQEAVYIDKEEEEIKIDKKVFLKMFQSRTEAQQSEIYQKHINACNALNDFFSGLNVKEEDIKRYFSFEGIVKVNPDSVNVKSYMRLNFVPKAPSEPKKESSSDKDKV